MADGASCRIGCTVLDNSDVASEGEFSREHNGQTQSLCIAWLQDDFIILRSISWLRN